MFIYSFDNKEMANEALAVLEEGYPHYSFNIVDVSTIHGKALLYELTVPKDQMSDRVAEKISIFVDGISHTLKSIKARKQPKPQVKYITDISYTVITLYDSHKVIEHLKDKVELFVEQNSPTQHLIQDLTYTVSSDNKGNGKWDIVLDLKCTLLLTPEDIQNIVNPIEKFAHTYYEAWDYGYGRGYQDGFRCIETRQRNT